MKKEYYYGILPLALTSCLVSQTSAQERQINRPNVVFIYADDIGYGDLSNRSVFANNLVDVHFVPYVCRAPLHGELSKIFLSVHDRR